MPYLPPNLNVGSQTRDVARGVRIRRLSFLSLLVPLAGACQGDIGGRPVSDPGESDINGAQNGGGAAVPGGKDVRPLGQPNGTNRPVPSEPTGPVALPPPPAGGTTAGPLQLRRLTGPEYRRTVAALFPMAATAQLVLPEDARGPWGYTSAGLVKPEQAKMFYDAAASIAVEAVKGLAQLLPCPPTAVTETCALQFISTVGRRVYRRPLSEAEIKMHRMQYDGARADGTVEDGVRVVLQTMLQSPYFLYRAEFMGDPTQKVSNALVRVGPHQLVSRLSYFLWGSMPDAELFTAGDSGRVLQPEELEKQARRLLADPRARPVIEDFHSEWLGLDNLASVQRNSMQYPLFNPALKSAMQAETRAFVGHLFFEGDRKLSTLLSAPYSFVNEPLAKLYKLTGITGNNMRKVDMPAAERSGMLGQAGFLSLGVNPDIAPIERGLAVLLRVLCQQLPGPPEGVPELPPRDRMKTVREQLAQHSSDPQCRGCHDRIEGIGFGFEHYDAIGQFRAMDGVRAVNASATVTIDGAPRSYQGLRELAPLLAASKEAASCMVTQWLRFGFGRTEVAEDGATRDRALASLNAAGGDVREMLVSLVGSDSFRYRSVATEEVLP